MSGARAATFLASAALAWASLAGARSLLGADAPGQVEGTVTVPERLRGRTGAVVVLVLFEASSDRITIS